jgi:signal transduction histidine kinase
MKWSARWKDATSAQWLASGNAIVESVRTMNWSGTPLGDLARWPQSLRTASTMCLNSPIASCLVWGPARAQVYNESFRVFYGEQHPAALGQDFAEYWKHSWPQMRPAFERALAGSGATAEILPPPLGTPAESALTPLNLAFVPVHDESGSVGGVLVSVMETSARVELERTRKDLEALNYSISHDLRSPLHTMKEMARIMLEEHAKHLPPDTGIFLKHFVNGTEKLGERVEGLVRFSRVSRRTLHRHRVDVAFIVADLITDQREKAQEKGRQIEVQMGPLPDATGEPELIRQVFEVVLENAFKYTRNVGHARIEIQGTRQGGQNEYVISDNGAGFDMKYAGRLFGLFQRLHGDAEFEGTGVGLALARRILERHGGTIHAEATRGGGARFHFTLPAAQGDEVQ